MKKRKIVKTQVKSIYRLWVYGPFAEFIHIIIMILIMILIERNGSCIGKYFAENLPERSSEKQYKSFCRTHPKRTAVYFPPSLLALPIEETVIRNQSSDILEPMHNYIGAGAI